MLRCFGNREQGSFEFSLMGTNALAHEQLYRQVFMQRHLCDVIQQIGSVSLPQTEQAGMQI